MVAQAHESADTVLGKIVWSKVVKDVLEGKGVLQTRHASLDRHRMAPELKDFNMTRMEVGKRLDDKIVHKLKHVKQFSTLSDG